ncbi:MAG: 3-hydroxyacyl-ACP dehydratase FabZ [Kiritimatiellae bacterium]|nr:3-hydroxyacyl-ACP dehydratase FabZ [Kiritimatiellia bacterium]
MATILTSQEIQNLIPHRYPMLLVDRIIECDDQNHIVGIKNISVNEPFFQGHFPGSPIMPGVLQLEAMAQVGGILHCRKTGSHSSQPLFMGVDNAKFRKMITPGDQMRIEVEITTTRGNVIRAHGRVLVDGQLASEANLLFMLTDQKV